MDIDFCHALAAGLFEGDSESVVFVELIDAPDAFVALANDDADVVAGVTWNLQHDIREPTTGMGFSFSQPYFYGYSEEEDNFSLATRQEDHDWAAYVFWIPQAIVFAEENGIRREKSNDLPQVFLFGSSFKRML